jgi:branched-chain amino acid transport system ATP-binding protein
VSDGRAPVLRCDGLSKRYGAVQAVRNVSFELRAGEVLGLVGPNGAGKTTLVDLVGGEQRPDSGVALLRGRRLAGPPSRRARRNGLARTFQHPQVALDLTVRENILVGATAARMGSVPDLVGALFSGFARPGTEHLDAEVARIAGEVGLPDVHRRCSQLTLGQLRLVEVARALALRPAVVLLDEPFAGGDAGGVAGVSAAIRHIAASGCGVILVDHNVDIVARLVDRIVLLNFGVAVFDGSPAECLASVEMQDVYFGAAH